MSGLFQATKEPTKSIRFNHLDPYRIFSEVKYKRVDADFKHLREHGKQDIYGKTAVVPISLGQTYHQGPYLAAFMDLLSSYFGEVTFIFGDTLTRYNLAMKRGKNADECWAEAREEGEAFFAKHARLFYNIDLPYVVKNWDTILQDNDFNDNLQKIEQLYQQNPQYEAAINETADIYLNRLYKQGELTISYQRAKQICLNYLKEECSAMLVWAKEGAEYEVYPTGKPKAIEATYEHCVEPYNSDILKPLQVRFEARKCNHIQDVATSEHEINADGIPYNPRV